MLEVPAVVRSKALAVGAEAWLDALPLLVARLEVDWRIAVGRAYPEPTEAFVAEAVCADGTPAVLKLIVPRDTDAARHEIAVLRLAGGEGCARLLRDDAVEALVERLFPLATVVTPNALEAQALSAVTGLSLSLLSERVPALGAPAVVVTGGHADRSVYHLYDGHEHVEIPVERHEVAATHGAGCTH